MIGWLVSGCHDAPEPSLAEADSLPHHVHRDTGNGGDFERRHSAEIVHLYKPGHLFFLQREAIERGIEDQKP